MGSENLSTILQETVSDLTAFQATISEENVQFGHQKDKKASLVGQPSPFAVIEQRVRSLLHTRGAWIVDESTKLRREYTPHVTVQHSRGLRVGDVFWCRQLYIIEQAGEHKTIVGSVNLKDE